MTIRRLRIPLLLFGLFTAIGLLLTSAGYFDDLSRAHYNTLPLRLTEELVGAYTAFALLPFTIWIARRFRITRSNWPAALSITLLGALVYSAIHTTMNAFGRDLVSLATGQGPYDYGVMFYRYPMEASKDIIYFLVFIGCVDFIDGLGRERNAQIAAAELQTKLAQAQLDNFRLQLHPHFLFNTLNAISTVMYEDVRKADEMLAKLSDFLRMVLALGNVHIVPLDEELKIERMYVDIMTTRLERKLSLNIDISDDARDAAMPFMILQPLIENSIRHGMSGNRDALDISIAIRRENGSTVVDLTDDGAGFGEDAPRGHGLANIESRLFHMYGAASAFSIAPLSGGGTRATLRFPYASGGSNV